MFAENGVWLQEKLKAAERKAEYAGGKAEEKWKAWAEKGAQVNEGKAVSAERKKWQAKGKAPPVETVDDGTQTELEKGKGRAKDSEDTVKKDGSDNSDTYREMYEDLSG